jgi:hypothetical protein
LFPAEVEVEVLVDFLDVDFFPESGSVLEKNKPRKDEDLEAVEVMEVVSDVTVDLVMMKS